MRRSATPRLGSTFTALIFCACAALVGCDQPSPSKLHVNEGARFPELQFKTLHGEPATTAQFAGKAMVVNIWATWCGPCRRELPSLQRLADKLDPQRFAVIGVSIDNDDHLVREFLIDRKVHFANFQDADLRVANEVLGLRAYPSTYLVASDGTVRRVVERAEEWDSPQWVDTITKLAPG